jgi:hypothetical protein
MLIAGDYALATMTGAFGVRRTARIAMPAAATTADARNVAW